MLSSVAEAGTLSKSMFRSIALILLISGCGKKTASSAWHWTAAPGPACVGGSIVLTGPSAPLPQVEAVINHQAVPLDAALVGGKVEVTIPPTLSVGIYDLLIVRPSDNASVTLPHALDVRTPPTVSSVSGQTACTSQTTPQTVTIIGSGFSSSTTVSVQDVTAAIPVTVNADGTSLSAMVDPSTLSPGQIYPLNVSNGGSCAVSVANGPQAAPPPSVSSFAFGPKLQSGSAVQSATITLRLTGASFTAGSNITLGGTAPTGLNLNSDGTLDATFAPGLGSGDNAITVANGICQINAGSVPISAPTLTFDHLNPSEAAISAAGGFVDVYGDFSASGPPTLEVSFNSDPTNESWTAFDDFAALDGHSRAYRFRLPPLPAQTYDLRLLAGSGEAFAQNGFTINTEANQARLVSKDKDWINADGDTLTLWGCGIGGSETYSLVDATTFAPITGTSVIAGAATSSTRFECEADTQTLSQTTLTINAPPGEYRLRATLGTMTSDDLYPLTVYDSSVTLTAPNGGDLFIDAKTPLHTARRGPGAVVASDPIGRKYVYVFGGDNIANISPAQTASGAIQNSYESSAVDPWQGLVGFSTPVTATLGGMGSAMVVGPSIFWLGGNSTTSSVYFFSAWHLADPIANPMQAGALVSVFSQSQAYTASGGAFFDSGSDELINWIGSSGGFIPPTPAESMRLPPSGSGTWQPFTTTSTIGAQAFGASQVSVSGGTTTAVIYFGIQSNKNGRSIQTLTFNSGSATSGVLNGNGLPYYGFAFIAAPKLFFLGGADVTNNAGSPFTATATNGTFTLASDALSALSGDLPTALTFPAEIFLPPFSYTLSGVACDPTCSVTSTTWLTTLR